MPESRMGSGSFGELEGRRVEAKSSFEDVKKHYVRANGWLPIFKKYAAKRPDGVKYLTLCGKNSIDVRYFRQKRVLPHDDRQKIYPTLTFIESDSQDFSIISESLGTTKLGLHGSLEEIVLNPHKLPEKFGTLMATFPHDIINLDFCGEVMSATDPPYSTTIRTIERIIQEQHDKHASEWHLFLTFAARKTKANASAHEQIQKIVEGNLAKSSVEKAAYADKPTPGDMLANDYKEFLRIGVSKFLTHSANERGFKINLDQSYFYKRRDQMSGEEYFIVKLIVGFELLRPHGHLTNPHDNGKAYSDTVVKIFKSSAIDVNRELRSAATNQSVLNDLEPVKQEIRRLRLVD